jgi:hypothetical protein
MTSIIQSVLHGLQGTGAGRNNPKGGISHHSVGLQLWSKMYDIQVLEGLKETIPLYVRKGVLTVNVLARSFDIFFNNLEYLRLIEKVN